MSARSVVTCLAFALSCVPAAGPWAYSDEAIADGEALLKTLEYGATFGKVTGHDLAVVRYYVLELKRAAGNLPDDAFCPQAQAQIRIMITAEGDEVTKAGLAERRDEVETMTRSPELCRQAVAAVDGFLFGATEPAKTGLAVKIAEDALSQARRKYQAGEAEQLDVTRAEADLLEAQYVSGQSTRAEYCGSNQAATLAHLTQFTEQLAQLGQAGLLERIAAKRRYWAFKALCPDK